MQRPYGGRELKELKEPVECRGGVVVLSEELSLILREMERYKGVYAIRAD